MKTGYAFEMFFDSDTENKIIAIWKILAEKKLSSFMIDNGGRPHISLSVYSNLDIDTAGVKLERFCRKHKPFQIVLCFPGSFISDDNVIFVAPVINEQLLNIHYDFHDEFSELKDIIWDFYLPNMWQPHCTFTMETPDNLFPDTFNEVKKNFTPMAVSIQSVGITAFRPIEIIREYKLG